MKEFDKNIKNRISEEELEVPLDISKMIEETLENLPEKEIKLQTQSYPKRGIAIAASVAFFFFVFMPNISVVYAQTLQDVPIIGDIVKVFTIRKEIYEDGKHELNAEIPQIENELNEDSAALINRDIDELTTAVIQKFYEEIELNKDGFGSIYLDYEVLTNDDSWFTLKINVSEVVGSSDEYAKYYHIDRVNGTYVQLEDVLSQEGMMCVKEYIINTMKAQMKQDEDIVYFLEDDVQIITGDTNFYYNENNDLVIVYDKYDVAPGYMGCPEFVIPKDVYVVHKNMK